MIEIHEIYDAAFDRSRFADLLRRLVEALDAKSGFIGWADQDSGAGFQVQFGNDPEFLQRYVETYRSHDVMLPILHGFPEGVATAAYPYLQQPEIQASIFYREYLEPQGIVDNLAVNLIKRPGIVATLAIIRTEPSTPFSKDDIAKLADLIPHLRRAVFLQSHVIRQSNLVRGYRQAARSSRGGLILLDEGQRLLDIDPEIETLTGLRVGEAVDRTGVGKTIAAAIRNRAPQLAEVGNENGVIRLLCHAQSIERDPYGDLADGPGVAFAVHVTRLDQELPVAFGLVGSTYGLTPTEQRVLEDAFAYGETVGLGERLGMARGTTRTHLHRIYEKTATRGFADLCLLVSRFILRGPVVEQPRCPDNRPGVNR